MTKTAFLRAPSIRPSLRPSRRSATCYPHAQLPPRLWCRARQSSTYTPSTIASLWTQSPSAPIEEKISRDGGQLTINGFVRTVRKQKRVAFAAIGDGSSLQTVQAVFTPEQAEGLSTGVAVSITGQWTPSPGNKQSHELQVESVRILGENNASTYPLQKKYHTTEFLRTLPHLRSRLPLNSLLLRLRSQVAARLTNFFSARDFIQVHPPIITSSDCEGAGEVFTVAPAVSLSPHAEKEKPKQADSFFQSPKYLTVSTQLHLEALAQSVGKVWTLSPTFRAEKSDTPRHLSEFYMLEAEAVFVEDLGSIMDIVENMVRDVAVGLQNSHVGEELLAVRDDVQAGEEGSLVTKAILAQRWQRLIDGPWPRITYSEAIQHLMEAEAQQGVHFDFKPDYHSGLQTEHERFLAENVGKGGPIFVTDYPRDIKPFYMAPSTDTTSSAQEQATVACFDLLVPEICELVGGSMREHRLPELLDSMDKHGLKRPSSDPDLTESDGSLQCYESLPPNFSLTANMLAGAFAGIAEHSVMYPIDLLKTRMQVMNPSPAAVYSGISNAMITISRAEGFRTLWKGVSSVVLGAGPAHAVYFASYEAVKHALGGNEGGHEEHHPFAAAASGAAATIASDALMNPFDVIKQRMQLHGSIYRSVGHCARTVFQKEGFTAFYVSYPTTLCMTVPFTALQFMAYESISKTMNPTGRYDPYTHCTAGGLAGGLAAGLTTPLDVIKTLLQTRGNATEPELRNVSGLWQAAAIIKKRDGWKGFFRGLKPRIITTMPSTAICWSAYEMAKAFFIARNEAS
ncbi:asparaginyl-tRNA synthetase [Delitschia confertaspora ATCC 74209]|uniref:asparagine--tRNA ligase n=1 Tax=Delitschia confertaspora ATCC 74209 TaxID=1513339 RepID=A0A9P4JPC2_9PLEO|nr:asparaginyl-tRNA synthetase [Delitschia confertaspora ATCC 74209]